MAAQLAECRDDELVAIGGRAIAFAGFGLRLPLLGRSYLVLLVGKDMRSPPRRAADRQLRPADRLSTLVLSLLGLSAFALAVLIGVLVQNAFVAS